MTERGGFAIVGVGVMGRNLALNVEEHGFTVVLHDRDFAAAQALAQAHPQKNLVPCESVEQMVAALERPRRILAMVPAGGPVDAVIQSLRPHLEDGDVLIDGGNSWFEETRRREEQLRATGLRFFGMGVSGGEDGARHGPSLMPGGDPAAYEALRPVLESIAAKTDSGPCVTHVGTDGAGHFVKMVHNGIEYADMQLIAEAYDLLHRGLGLDAAALEDTFNRWNHGPLESFLIEITGQIFGVKDTNGTALVEAVLDRAGQKGTGRWTARTALDLGVPVPSIAAAVDARVLSSMKDERMAASQSLAGSALPWPGSVSATVIHDALLAAKICAYAQGLHLIATASAEYKWGVQLSEIARIWKGGCIIRARLLDTIMAAYREAPGPVNLLRDAALGGTVVQHQSALRQAVQAGAGAGIPVPGLAASLAYFDAYRTADLPQNLTQAQRDAFGAHTYRRKDNADGPAIHTDWL